ncbi:nuclear transport factor 2 family protein [Cellulosimicrobium sp. CUA-896]|uniref:nuclear transport factor 2 family protein n=1 Tax=Cellulosimicrobium sp. CUA-896 TaxID=1517881 RepID=UPI00096898B4|nr:nuclear transport factor 2 family protein [Cellulosimicrobium sp. CUA-896]OLT46131.1 hypothetical protein BJF88_04745 [Cellulosimicrobium sp. CUA-896]
MSDGLDPVERLEATEAVRRLQARLCRAAGERVWADVDRCFCGDGQLRGYRPDGELAWFADAPDIGTSVGLEVGPGTLSVHAFGEELVVHSPTRAEGMWTVEGVLVRPDGTVRRDLGYAHQTYHRHDGRWLVRSAEFRGRHLER